VVRPEEGVEAEVLGAAGEGELGVPGDVCAGDPAIDLSIAFGALAGPARAAFLAAHGALDAATELRARAIALTLATTLLTYALDQRLSHVESECRRALAAAVS